MLLDWVDESDDLRAGECEVKQKSNTVDSEEAQPAAFPGQCLMVSHFLTMLRANSTLFFPINRKD